MSLYGATKGKSEVVLVSSKPMTGILKKGKVWTETCAEIMELNDDAFASPGPPRFAGKHRKDSFSQLLEGPVLTSI